MTWNVECDLGNEYSEHIGIEECTFIKETCDKLNVVVSCRAVRDSYDISCPIIYLLQSIATGIHILIVVFGIAPFYNFFCNYIVFWNFDRVFIEFLLIVACLTHHIYFWD